MGTLVNRCQSVTIIGPLLDRPCYEQTLTPAPQQTLINQIHSLYAEDPRFLHLKLWPPARDWLKNHFPDGGLNIPD